jgi:predicted TIM-barrel fold metal-dependent hydrolase
MKYFDANCIIGDMGTNIPGTAFFSPDDVIASMDRLGIDKSIVSALSDRENLFSTDIALKKDFLDSLEDHKDRLLPALSINLNTVVSPGYNTEKYADKLLNLGADIFIYNVSSNMGVESWKVDNIAGKLSDAGALLCLDLYPGRGTDGSRMADSCWNDIYPLAQNFPNLNIIIFAQKINAEGCRIYNLMSKCSNIYLNIAAYQKWMALEYLYHEFGADRLLFGSFAPLFDQEKIMLEIVYANIPAEAKEKISYKNLAKLLKE